MSSKTTASNLQTRSKRQVINEIIRDITKSIDTKIETAHGKGLDMIVFELPTTFGILGMEKVDQQTLIYSELVRLYSRDEDEGGRGMDIEYIVTSSKPIVHKLKITWQNGMSEIEKEKRKSILDSVKRVVKK